ncbi:hypothetical protein B484DRAFT_439562, partial [Ochromonadaceae sp. CCMP2298]
YLWLKGDVEYEDEYFCNLEMGFLNPIKKFALLVTVGFARPSPPYLSPNSPAWRYIVTMSEGVESLRVQSKRIDEMAQEAVRLIDSTVDASNGSNDFSVKVTEKELQPVEWAKLFCLRQDRRGENAESIEVQVEVEEVVDEVDEVVEIVAEEQEVVEAEPVEEPAQAEEEGWWHAYLEAQQEAAAVVVAARGAGG